jgi:hypothetical protein
LFPIRLQHLYFCLVDLTCLRLRSWRNLIQFPAKPEVEFWFLSAMPNRKSNFGFWVTCRMTVSCRMKFQ